VLWYIGIQDFTDQAGLHFAYLTTATGRGDTEDATVATLTTDLEDPFTFAAAVSASRLSTEGASVRDMPIVIDTTDTAGNGILVATDRLFIVGGNLSGIVAATYVAKVLYRLVEVGIQEYVGIVQSQQ